MSEAPTARASASAIELPLADPLVAPVSAPPRAALPSNAALTRDFMELSFALESGRPLPRFTRFEGPITVSLTGKVHPVAPRELDRLVARLRHEANIPISVGASATDHINVEFLPKSEMKRQVPNAACFVVPGVSNWQDYLANRRTARTDWTQLARRERMTVFVPSDSTPQEVRDCLHEEVSQALGPVNDLYRLPDTVWNDDNFHTTLTRYDMTILRAYYAPQIWSGMSQPEVLAAMPRVLAQVNPAGGPVKALHENPTPAAYVRAINRALGGVSSLGARKAAAREAIAISASQGWTDTRAAFGWFVLGRLELPTSPAAATNAFINAGTIYRRIPGAGIQAAHVDMQLAAYALSSGRAQDAIQLVNRSLSAALNGENAALMATLYMIRAEAYDQLGNIAQARQARLDMAQWARYGFGSDAAVRRRASEVAALADAGARTN
ncbi:DUF2927 domain-containing protein [Thioclava sp. A2]|uniref:DUF2927 domain-containing protein n=1 Tax=Thioclava sp. FCG-A2 TaxID=3080562 RepID=UPI002955D341|nr:DUF2927 domain-containing protein [Thioclava sp. A2]